MDIRRWLVETVEQSDEDLHHGRDGHHRHKDDPHRYRRAATLLPEVPLKAPSRHEHVQHKERRHKRKISEAHSAEDASSSTAGSSTSSESSSSSSAPSEHFERRQRHKTRKDLYEPHSGVRKKRTKQDDKAEGKAQKRKKEKEKQHRRTEKKKRRVRRPGQDFHENFTAKNVRDDRLTLKPRPMLGLLKKGRASSPTKPHGLPDLVFSEMQFLKKPRPPVEQSGHAEKITTRGKKRGKKNNKVEEEEVSAYFGTVQTHKPKDCEETVARTATPTTSSSKPRAATEKRPDRARELPARATVEDLRRTQSQSPPHALRSKASDKSTLRTTSFTAPLGRVANQAGQLQRAQLHTTSSLDTAAFGVANIEATDDSALPVPTPKDVSINRTPRHNQSLPLKLSEGEIRNDTVKTIDIQSATMETGPIVSHGSIAMHDSPMAKLLHACQTSVLGPPARRRGHIDVDDSGTGSIESRQSRYTAGHSARVVRHHAADRPSLKDFRFAQPTYADKRGISALDHGWRDHSGMESFEARQPNYRSGDPVRLPGKDNIKPVEHAWPQYNVHHPVSILPYDPGIELMQEPHNGFIDNYEHDRYDNARPPHDSSYDANYQLTCREYQPHRLIQQQQQQQQYQHDHHQREYVVMAPQNQYASAAPMHTSNRQHTGIPYQEKYSQQHPRHEGVRFIDDQIPHHHNMHAEQYHYAPQPLRQRGMYYEDHEDLGQQDVEIYQDYDTGYKIQEQEDLYIPQQYQTPQYDMQDPLDLDTERQIAEEEMMAIKQGGIEDQENEESERFVPDSFWKSRKRR